MYLRSIVTTIVLPRNVHRLQYFFLKEREIHNNNNKINIFYFFF